MATIHQRDGEVIRCPIYESTRPVVFYDAGTVPHTATLVVKASRFDTDASGTTIAGTIVGDMTVGYAALFAIPTSITATAGRRWMHAWVTPSGGDPKTIANEVLDVTPT